MYTTLFIYEFVYALAEGTNSDHVVGKEATQLEFEDVYATDLTDTFIPYCMITPILYLFAIHSYVSCSAARICSSVGSAIVLCASIAPAITS